MRQFRGLRERTVRFQRTDIISVLGIIERPPTFKNSRAFKSGASSIVAKGSGTP